MTDEWRVTFAQNRAARARADLCDRCDEPAREGKTQCERHAAESTARALASYRRRRDRVSE